VKQIVLTLSIIAFVGAAWAQETPNASDGLTQRVAYVNTEAILEQWPPAIKAQGELEDMVDEWNAQLDSMTLALQTEYADVQKRMNMMTEEQLQQAQQDLVAMQQEAEQFRQSKFAQPNGELYTKREELLGPINEKILEAIELVAQEEGVQFVFNKQGEFILLYADQEFEMTFKVLDKLRTMKVK
jgi:outer membrane protein